MALEPIIGKSEPLLPGPLLTAAELQKYVDAMASRDRRIESSVMPAVWVAIGVGVGLIIGSIVF